MVRPHRLCGEEVLPGVETFLRPPSKGERDAIDADPFMTRPQSRLRFARRSGLAGHGAKKALQCKRCGQSVHIALISIPSSTLARRAFLQIRRWLLRKIFVKRMRESWLTERLGLVQQALAPRA